MKFIKNYQFSLVQKSQKIVLYLFLIILTLGLFEALILSPQDYLQGDSVRIMYVHVPSAWISLGIFSLMASLSVMVIIFKNKVFFLVAKSLAPSGFIFSLVALVTGSIWGKPTWGTWWVWDARLTSELILLFIYLGHIILSNAFDDFRKGDRNASILAIVGLINLPIIKWSVDWWNTLHQPASLTKFGAPSIDSVMLFPLIFMALGLTFLFVSILLDRIKGEIYLRKIELFKQDVN